MYSSFGVGTDLDKIVFVLPGFFYFNYTRSDKNGLGQVEVWLHMLGTRQHKDIFLHRTENVGAFQPKVTEGAGR
jgi:hypothetical protein